MVGEGRGVLSGRDVRSRRGSRGRSVRHIRDDRRGRISSVRSTRGERSTGGIGPWWRCPFRGQHLGRLLAKFGIHFGKLIFPLLHQHPILGAEFKFEHRNIWWAEFKFDFLYDRLSIERQTMLLLYCRYCAA